MKQKDSQTIKREWKTAQTEHEGFPLLLRTPFTTDYYILKPKYPMLLIVTHILDKTQTNGLPELEYNYGLEDFDCDLVEVFLEDKSGEVVLIETFAGERNYYFYISVNADTETLLTDLQNKYPDNKINWETKSDNEWKFIQRYSRDYSF